MRVNKEFFTRRFIVFAGILFLAVLVIIGLIVIKKKSTSAVNPVSAIPVDASFILKVNNLHNINTLLFQKNKIWMSLNTISPFKEMTEHLYYLDSLSQGISDFSDILYKSTVFVSGHYIGGRRTEFLFLIERLPGENLKQVIDLLESVTNEKIKKTERKYEGKSIYTWAINESNVPVTYYLALIEGNILLSKSVILIENCIRQYSLPKSLLSDTDFVTAMSTAGKNKDANLYIDLGKFTGMLSAIASDSFTQPLKNYKNFGKWVVLDLNVTEKQMMLNGFMGSEGMQNSFVNLFEGNTPITISADKILPASVSTFFSIGAEDMKKFHQQFELYLEETGSADKRSKRIQDIESRYKIEPEELFLSFIDNEITIAHGSYQDKSLTIPTSYVLVKCRNGEQSQKKMKSLVEAICAKKGLSMAQLTHTYSVDNDTKYSIVEFPIEDITGLLFGGLFSLRGNCYYTMMGNYLLFGDSEQALGDFLYNNVLSKTLSTSEIFKAFSSNIVQKSFFIAYTNLSRSSLFFQQYLNEKICKEWEKNFDLFQVIQPMGFQITEVSNMMYANLIIQYLDDYKGKPQTIWESLLDTTFSFKPQLVENHYTKQNEIFLQDNGNTIYLINKAGRVLWRQKITEPINSKIYQVDYFKNGKLQLLFSSQNYIHLIDRNGNYVERYPVRLRDKATTGMSLFDYDENREYRILVPCADHKIYAYGIDGTLINGWQFEGSDYDVIQPVEHFRIGDKDFIVFGDKFGVYILDRRGNTRVTTDKMIAKSKQNTFYIDNRGNLDNSRIVTTDTAGNVVSIYFNGSTSTASPGNFSSSHFFDFKDVDADGIKDYIFVDNNMLQVYNQDNSEIFNFHFPDNIKDPPIYFNFSSSDRKIGIVDATEKKIYLFNNNGQLYKGFPLEGSTLFSIGYLENSVGQFNLIVGGRNNFLYNYSVK
jgi:hypothetical protein